LAETALAEFAADFAKSRSGKFGLLVMSLQRGA